MSSSRPMVKASAIKQVGAVAIALVILAVFSLAAFAAYTASQTNINTLSKTTAYWSSGQTYLLWSDGKLLPSSREYKIDGKTSGTQVGESSECVALVKAVCGAPATSKWKRGRQVITSNLPRGTAIATFSDGMTYSGHATILAGLRSNGSIDCWSQNWQNPFVKRHTIAKTDKGGVSDSAAYYEIVLK